MVKVLFYFNEQELLCDLQNSRAFAGLQSVPSNAQLGSHQWVFINLCNLQEAENRWRNASKGEIQAVYQYSRKSPPDKLEDDIMCRFITAYGVKGLKEIYFLYQ
jgi:hypothetical protein